MFCDCTKLIELNISNFNTINVKDMSLMFSKCYSLEKLNITNFKTNNETRMVCMFYGTNKKLKDKIKSQKIFKEEAFKL